MADRRELNTRDTETRARAALAVAYARAGDPERALDHLDGLRAFVPTPAGQDRVWTEVGYEHPLDGAFNVEDDQLLCITGEGAWWRLPVGNWTDVDNLVEADSLGWPGQQVAVAGEQAVEVIKKVRASSSLKLTSAYYAAAWSACKKKL